jgi:hypothetical protein
MVMSCDHLGLRRRHGLLFLALSLPWLGGCTVGGRDRSSDPVQDLPILWQQSGTYSRITRITHVVARNQQELAQVALAEVPVDFNTQMVLVVGLGPTPSNELGVRIARVWQEGSRIRVQERRIYPGTERSPGAEPASPWTIAVVPKSDLNVEGYLTRAPKGTLGEHAGAR